MSRKRSKNSTPQSSAPAAAPPVAAGPPVRVIVSTAGLPALDRLNVEALAVTIGPDDRPPWGLTGWIDWRLNGRISALILDDLIDTTPGACLCLTTDGRLSPPLLFLIGRGAAKTGFAAWRDEFSHTLEVAAKFGKTFLGFAPATVSADVAADWDKALVTALASGHGLASVEVLVPPSRVEKLSERISGEPNLTLARGHTSV